MLLTYAPGEPWMAGPRGSQVPSPENGAAAGEASGAGGVSRKESESIVVGVVVRLDGGAGGANLGRATRRGGGRRRPGRVPRRGWRQDVRVQSATHLGLVAGEPLAFDRVDQPAHSVIPEPLDTSGGGAVVAGSGQCSHVRVEDGGGHDDEDKGDHAESGAPASPTNTPIDRWSRRTGR